MSNFQPLEFVCRGSETQPQVVENVNKLEFPIIFVVVFSSFFITAFEHLQDKT